MNNEFYLKLKPFENYHFTMRYVDWEPNAWSVSSELTEKRIQDLVSDASVECVKINMMGGTFLIEP